MCVVCVCACVRSPALLSFFPIFAPTTATTNGADTDLGDPK